eukprot:2489824-Rhodomonas_salina.2
MALVRGCKGGYLSEGPAEEGGDGLPSAMSVPRIGLGLGPACASVVPDIARRTCFMRKQPTKAEECVAACSPHALPQYRTAHSARVDTQRVDA